MVKKLDNKGISLIELIVAIAIMAVLVGILSPAYSKYIGRAKQVKVEEETSALMKAAQLAFVEVSVAGKEPKSDAIKNKTVSSSPYYKSGTKYGNLTNWTVHNGVVATNSNAAFGEEFFKILGITIGKDKWQNGSSSIPVSASQPKMSQAGSMTKECIFQLFYDAKGNLVVEYSREGYFVRMENYVVVESVKVNSASEKHFTAWQ